MKAENKHTYFAFLLRLWRDDAVSPWRVSIENPHSGEKKIFRSLAQLMVFLNDQTNAEEFEDEEENDISQNF